jgi:hypothetical protein
MNQRIQIIVIGAVSLLAMIIAVGLFERASSDVPRQFNLERDWTPEIPKYIQNRIKAKFVDSLPKQKAMLQFAHALWMTLAPNQDLDKSDSRLDRAMDCTFFRKISYEDSQELEAEVFFTDELTQKYLKWNKKFAGQIIRSRDYDEASCD